MAKIISPQVEFTELLRQIKQVTPEIFDQEGRFQADNPVAGQSCIALATPGTVRTTCENGGVDVGSFNGVALEDYGNELVLTAHAQAGWYRYVMKWHFYADGSMWPEFAFGATPSTCTTRPHTHHVYWRLDFDLDGAAGDRVREVNDAAGTDTLLAVETQRTWGAPADGVHWVVEDVGAGHTESAWAERFGKAVRLMLGGTRVEP